MSQQTNWLRGEIEAWVSEGLIDRSTGLRLKARYPVESEQDTGFSLLTAIGAVIFGLGVILFFAYNWETLPKIAKLAMVFISLAGFHLLAWFIRVKDPGRWNLVEGFHLTGTMLFGAGIFLIAQIYHIDEHYPTAFLVWGVGALLFGWVLPSSVQGVVATVLIAAWGTSEVLDFDRQHLLGIALVVIAVLPLAWVQRSRVLLFCGIVTAIGLGLVNIGTHVSGELVIYLLFAVGVLLVAMSYAVGATSFPQSADVLRAIGVTVYGIFLFAMTFVRSLIGNFPTIDSGSEQLALWCVLGASFVIWLAMIWYGILKKFERTKILQHGLILLSILVVLLQALISPSEAFHFVSYLYDAILAAHCVLLIIRGTDNLKWQQVVLGCLVLAALVYARFNDLFESLLMRSLVFVVLGAMLFFIGHLYSKRKQREQVDA